MAFILKTDCGQKDIVFDTFIDDGGDLMITANGVSLMFIDHTNGVVARYTVYKEWQKELPGIAFDKDGYIKVA